MKLRNAQILYQTNLNKQMKDAWQPAKHLFDSCQESFTLTQNDQRDVKYHKYGNKSWKTASLPN